MSVFGDSQEPGLGIIRSDQSAVDLINCPLGTAQITELMHRLRAVIRDYSLIPYNIATRQGELKQLVAMTTSDNSAGLLRFILRSTESIPRIRKAALELQRDLPWLEVISCNIQPIHAAIPEGAQEIMISEQGEIREVFGAIPLYLSPRSFMQVTPQVAKQLYVCAADLARARQPEHVLDLFCGVGGFALHLARYANRVTGVELSEAAILAAKRGANELGYTHVDFHSSDSEQYLLRNPNLAPDMVVVNPPRRGLSPGIIQALIRLKPASIIYSSCNPTSFARDVAALRDCYIPSELTPFDMFPLSEHCEVLCSLTRHS
jgi:23S rRNA (uracil747-C5)-methyltransferase